jgi:hypothetical protein
MPGGRAFAQAVGRTGVEDASFWSAKASDYLRAYFHAAALAGPDMRTVAAWVAGAGPGAYCQRIYNSGHQLEAAVHSRMIWVTGRVENKHLAAARNRRSGLPRGLTPALSHASLTALLVGTRGRWRDGGLLPSAGMYRPVSRVHPSA